MAAGGRDGDAATSLERAARDLEDGLGAGHALVGDALASRSATSSAKRGRAGRTPRRASSARSPRARRTSARSRRPPRPCSRRSRPCDAAATATAGGRAALRAAPRAREARLGPSHPQLNVPLMNAAAAYEDLRRYDDAGAALPPRARAPRGARAARAAPGDVASALNGVASVLRCRGRLDDAEALFARSLAITAAANAAEDPPSARVAARSAVRRAPGSGREPRGPGAYGDAEALLRRALKFDEMEHGADHPDTVPALSALLRRRFLDRAPYRDAEPYAQRILAIRERRAPGSRDVAVALNRLAVPARAAAVANRASLKRATGDFDGAGALYGEARASSSTRAARTTRTPR
ncbi:hypothetical protein SO694_00074031 [Aureococcus anophagefferens]|uniref:Tetratricopeptide repeat protein n=1 Tax=Aureococcus anophagefferens TaxID=44056 RepID=A0ABR1FHK6_AURAN